ncbi:hypothetical protein FSP39_010238 [Pinctada imbricata]|uniref:C2H2-type domain-containing protein n=1 Tax=Pinctada imbricata TaxID=66713 RepID=A0AA88XID8_PINIB|nr:hypothetical protein FSP39_010238 [Pinctada imbricata]
MEGDDIDDMHMCLVCQSTVLGLLNYVNHKKYHCPGRKNAQGPVPPSTGEGSSLNEHSVSTTPVSLGQPGLSSPPSNVSVSQNFLSPPEFKPSNHNNFHTLNVETPHRNGISTNENLSLASNNQGAPALNGDANLEQDVAMNLMNSEQLAEQKFESTTKAEMETEENSNPIVCTICDKKFYSKYVMTRHLLSKTHRNRTLGMTNILPVISQYNKYIVRLSPYQCSPCQFYSNRESDLILHMSMEEHMIQWKTLAAEVICTLCNFSSHSNEEIIEHFTKNLLHVTLTKKNRRLCVIREKNYDGRCKFCNKKIHSRVHMRRHLRHKHMVDTDSMGRVTWHIPEIR